MSWGHYAGFFPQDECIVVSAGLEHPWTIEVHIPDPTINAQCIQGGSTQIENTFVNTPEKSNARIALSGDIN